MTRPSSIELDRMRAVAGEICETLEADGYLVSKAVSHHTSFNQGRGPAGSLERALIKHAAARGASLAGVHSGQVTGGLELTSIDERTQRTYRVKTAKRRSDGTIDMVCGAGSALIEAGNSDSLLWEEKWVLGFMTTDDHTIDEIFIAQVIGHYGDTIIHLELGEPISLTPAPSPLGFHSSEEDDLEGFEDDRSDEDASSGVA